MFRFIRVMAATLVLSTGLAVMASDAEQQAKIDALVEQLGSDDFAQREAAEDKLVEIGPAALDAVREAADSDDAEVAMRAANVLERIGAAERTNHAWRKKLGGLTAGPVVEGDVIVFAEGGTVTALGRDGKARWKLTRDSDAKHMLAMAGAVVVASDNQIAVIDAATGKLLQTVKTNAAAHLAGDGKSRLAYTTETAVGVIDVKTGKTVLDKTFDKGVQTAPVLTATHVIVGADEQQVVALDLASGEAAWTAVADGRVGGEPIVANGLAYVMVGESVKAFDVKSGKLAWDATLGSAGAAGMRIVVGGAGRGKKVEYDSEKPQGTFAAADGTLYASRLGKLYALDGKSGRKAWEFETASKDEAKAAKPTAIRIGAGRAITIRSVGGLTMADSAPFAIHDDTAVVGGKAGATAVDLKTGKRLWQFPTASAVIAAPVIDEAGRAYVVTEPAEGSTESEMIALDVNPSAKPTPAKGRATISIGIGGAK